MIVNLLIHQKIMKRLCSVLILAACVLLFSSTMMAKIPVGKWVLVEFNGQPASDFGFTSVKVIEDRGTFTVLWSYDNLITFTVKQQGTVKETLPGVCVENTLLTPNGPNAIRYERKGKNLTLRYTYKNSPQKVITEKYVKYETYLKSLSKK